MNFESLSKMLQTTVLSHRCPASAPLVVDTNSHNSSHNNDEMSGVKPQSGMLDSFCKKNDNSLTLQELKNIEKERRALLLRVSSCMYCSAQLFVHITYC